MKPTEEDNQPKKQSELEELQQTGMRKSMRNLEDILLDVASGVDITKDEERLVDLVTFEKNGKRFGSFKNKKPVKKKTTDVVISADCDGAGQLEPVAKEVRTRKDPPTVSGVITKGSVS